ncbi:transposon Ty3-I Gag-Pol polyprotein [Trichonephila clavata]|uniref:Transposon Ty3-I Gag-Pol polyprotein n=1 Tax=Trichonephila clavata TaxID=2740835 RepID=A0A8X6LEW6_TRICU|nr:transposon Ty3-I Gag-Pol polyprotein [Trichonephila clavata]
MLGHLVSSNVVHPAPDKVKAVSNFPVPKSVHDIRSFRGLCSHFRRFIIAFCYLAEPLQLLLKGGMEESFESLKRAHTYEPVLAMYDENAPTEIHADAGGYDHGTVFQSRLISTLIDLCNINHCMATAYHPETNGSMERFNETLTDILSMHVDTEQKNWDEILPFVSFAYNAAC